MRPYLCRDEQIVLLDDLFAHDTEDSTWIPDIGARGWIIMTKDSAIQRRPNEQAALVSASTAVFVFTRGNVNSEQTARAIVTSLPRVREAVRRHEVPLLGRIHLSGELDVVVETGIKLTSPKRITRKG